MTTLSQTNEIEKLQTLLKFTFGLVPIAAGADKFLNLLTNWEHYLSPGLVDMLPFGPDVFMMIIGVVEIVAGIIVLTKTKLGAYIVSAWLLLIALSLLFTWHEVDVAVRDIVMAISAFVLAKLTVLKEGQQI
ncbi:hypothetical protein [Ulvibacter antarcticus]|uniref:DoxX-like protein n=1 Tax=Ulvibacter antarcticus TaxID=442714 RepID=A0A3L9YCG8_9FLAO|nr:hypothetical protein [Ulvibacter antarcticus]RMA57050.1 hypothetical protein BXY75_2931 [Ulvibacter antarcticus]